MSGVVRETDLRAGLFGIVSSIALAAMGCTVEGDNAEGAVATANLVTTGDDVDRPAFYETPERLPPNNGDLIRSEPLTEARLERSATSQVALTATRILYRSTRRDGTAIAVSGTVLVPQSRWVGPGDRPVLGYAVGTQGIGDTCAPSRQFDGGFEYEGVWMAGLLARGYALAVTDYEGLGTVGMHTYMDRVSQGHTVLDSVRAAQQLTGSGLSGTSPVALFGYSQGGGAAASAAELASTYAPELQIKGTAAGAVPAELSVIPANLDGTIWAEFLWYAIAGVSASYDTDISSFLNPKGRAFYKEISDDCVFNLTNAALKRSTNYTVDGSSLSDIIKLEPFRTMIDDQRIGRLKPNAPVLLTHSVLDDTIPFKVGKQLAEDWCALGATIDFSPNATPLHLGAMVNNVLEVYGFFEARFAGRPAKSSCSH